MLTMNDTIENRTEPNQTKKNNGVRQKKIDRKIFVLPLKCKQTNKFKRAIAEKYFMWTWEQSESNSQIYKKTKKRTRRIRNSHSRSHSAVQTHFYWVHAPFSVCANIIVIVTSKWGTSSCIGDIRTPEKSSEMTAMWWQGHNSLRKTVVNATLSIHTFSSIGCYCCCCSCNYFFFRRRRPLDFGVLCVFGII